MMSGECDRCGEHAIECKCQYYEMHEELVNMRHTVIDLQNRTQFLYNLLYRFSPSMKEEIESLFPSKEYNSRIEKLERSLKATNKSLTVMFDDLYTHLEDE